MLLALLKMQNFASDDCALPSLITITKLICFHWQVLSTIEGASLSLFDILFINDR